MFRASRSIAAAAIFAVILLAAGCSRQERKSQPAPTAEPESPAASPPAASEASAAEARPEAEPEAKPEAAQEPESKPEPEAKPEPEVKPEPEAEPEQEAEPVQASPAQKPRSGKKPAPGKEDSLPAQGQPCDAERRCAKGLSCVEYYGIAGARGPRMTSCEIRCPGGKGCPDGQTCVTIADGPGQVCRGR